MMAPGLRLKHLKEDLLDIRRNRRYCIIPHEIIIMPFIIFITFYFSPTGKVRTKIIKNVITQMF